MTLRNGNVDIYESHNKLSVFAVALSSRTDLCDDVVDVTSFSALDVAEIKSLLHDE